MKILHITNDYANNGTGITNLMRTLALQQRAEGLDVVVAAENEGSDYVDELADHGVEYLRIGGMRDVSSIRRVAARLRSMAPDVDVFHIHTMRAALAVVGAGPAVRRRSVATVHNVYQRSSVLMTGCAATVCISDDVRARLRKQVPWAARKLHVVYNAVDLTPPADALDLPDGAVVYVGGLHHRKGVDLLLDYMVPVLRDNDQARLYVVGNRDAPEVEEHARALGIADRVEFAGFMPDPRRAMAGATVVAIPSRDEPFGLVAAEARVCGVPIVASDIGGLREALGDASGELVAVGDVDGWAAAIGRVLTDPDHREQLRKRANAGVEVFAPERMEREYRAIYAGLPARRTSADS